MPTSLSWLQAEIYQRMLDKLEPIKLKPNVILIEPDFPSLALVQFAKRFPNARIDTLADQHLSPSQLLQLKLRRVWRSFLRQGRLLPQAPEGPDQYGLIVSALELSQLAKPEAWLLRAHQLITEGGLLCFSYLGPDTGKELKSLGLTAADCPIALPGALDMHDIGDALVQNGFSDPVMDMEYLYLEYESDATLISDALAIGLLGTNVGGLQGAKIKKLTLEIVYGHAWVLGKNLTQSDGQLAYIRPDAIKRK